MRFPFISRRRAQANVDLAVTAVWHLVDEAEAATCEARIEQRRAEAQLAAEQKLRRRTVAYVEQAEGRRDVDGYRLARALRAVATLRAEAAVQRRVVDRLTDQLLDATGHIGEPLLPAARVTLGLDLKEADA